MSFHLYADDNQGALFWYDSGIEIQGIDGIRVLLGPIQFSE